MKSKKTYHHIVPPLPERMRCSDYLVGIFPGLETKSAVKKALKKNWVKVEGDLADTGKWISGGEKITYYIKNIPIPTWEKKLKVHYEDEYLAIVEKPAGMPTSGNQFCNLRNALPFNLKPVNGADALTQPEPIHRLDAATSGLVLVAKTRKVRRLLGAKMNYKGIEKEYLALIQGIVEKHQQINIPIEGRSAITLIKKISSYSSQTYGIVTMVSASPVTGRTHQIRIHLASIGCPILGDKIYNQNNSRIARGLMLHAHRLEFYHPVELKKITVISPMPKRIRKRLPKH